MNKAWIALVILIGVITVACRSESTPSGTPAPAPTIGRAPFGAVPVSAISLLRAPADYLDLDIALSGQYKPLPLLVCGQDTHPSPATWAIVDGEIEILAAGFDDPLRELADTGLELVIEGRWQQWEGPIGCGRRVPAEKIWYLAVSNIVSPNPLVASDASGEAIAQLPAEALPEGNGDELLPPTPDQAAEPNESIEATVLAGPTFSGEEAGRSTIAAALTATPFRTATGLPTATIQQTGSVTATLPAGGQGTPTTSPIPASPTPGTPSPSITAGAGTSPAATSANTATATTAAGGSTPIGYEDLRINSISPNGSQTYQFVASSGDVINIAAAPQNGLDVSIQLIGPSGATLLTQALNGPGLVESLGPLTLAGSGIHKVIIHSLNGSGYYAMVVQETDALPYLVFKGNIAYGDAVSGSVPIDQDHLWNFMGSAGDTISIRAVATTDTDLILYLNDPDSIELDFVDENLTVGPPNDVEEIRQLPLTANGMYTIGVGEIDFNTIGYTLTLTRN